MSRAEELRAELDLLDLEQQYAAAKAGGATKDELRAMGLREAREAFRALRDGSAAATPPTVEAKSAVAKGDK